MPTTGNRSSPIRPSRVGRASASASCPLSKRFFCTHHDTSRSSPVLFACSSSVRFICFDLQALEADQCFSFFPFLWTREGSVEKSRRTAIDVSEQFEMNVELARKLANGSAQPI